MLLQEADIQKKKNTVTGGKFIVFGRFSALTCCLAVLSPSLSLYIHSPAKPTMSHTRAPTILHFHNFTEETLSSVATYTTQAVTYSTLPPTKYMKQIFSSLLVVCLPPTPPLPPTPAPPLRQSELIGCRLQPHDLQGWYQSHLPRRKKAIKHNSQNIKLFL